jgi:hypothetical protein
MTILTMPSIPNSLKLIAQGYGKITSTSNNTNKIAPESILQRMEYVRFLSLYSTFKVFFFISDLLGPSLQTIIVPTTNPAANKTVIKLERNLTDQIALMFM